MGKGEWGGEGGSVKVQKYATVIKCCSGDIFLEPRIFLLMTIADSPLLGQSASGLKFFVDSGSRPLAD